MKRTQVICLVCAVLLMAGQSTLVRGQSNKDTKPPSLYQRLGGSDTLGKIFDDVGPRMAADPLLAQFFQGQSADALTLQRQRTIDFLCRETGGPCEYKGEPIKKAHSPLKISEAQFKAFVQHLGETLDNLKIADKEKRDMLALVGLYKNDVVSKK